MRKSMVLAAVTVTLSGSFIYAQGERERLPNRVAAEPAGVGRLAEQNAGDRRSEDRNLIQAVVATFIKAFNAGDAAAAAATYTQTAVVVDENGQRVEGREAIQKQYAAFFAENRASKIEIRVDTLTFLGDDTALEEGQATITGASGGGEPELSRFTTVYVKSGGQWLQAAVRDESVSNLSPHEQLKKLEWMVGEWMNESDDAIVSATCDWAKGGNFLDR